MIWNGCATFALNKSWRNETVAMNAMIYILGQTTKLFGLSLSQTKFDLQTFY